MEFNFRLVVVISFEVTFKDGIMKTLHVEIEDKHCIDVPQLISFGEIMQGI